MSRAVIKLRALAAAALLVTGCTRHGETALQQSQDTLYTVTTASVSGLLVILLLAVYLYFQKRRIQQKNRALAKLIEKLQAPATAGPADNGALFATLDTAIRSERLYANPTFQRQDACEYFNLRREVLNQLLANYADGLSFPSYINGIRLSEACRLLREQPPMTVNAIAEAVGLTPRNLRRLFVEQYGMTPTEYRSSRA